MSAASRVLLLCAALAACNATPARQERSDEDLRRLQPGMTRAEVQAVLGQNPYGVAAYANGTTSWTWKYRDYNVAKLLHVTFGPDGRMLRYETQWDPNVYSKKSGSR